MFETQFLENSIPTSLTYFNNEPIIHFKSYYYSRGIWSILEANRSEEVEARRNLALNKTLFQEKNTLGLSQIAYVFLKYPLLKRIRTKNHPNIRHIAETMSIKDRKSCVLCCGSCIPDFPNQQNHKYREGYQTVNRCRFCKIFLGDLSCFD